MRSGEARTDAIAHYLDVFRSARTYRVVSAGVDRDLAFIVGPVEPMLERVDPLVATPSYLKLGEFDSLVTFVRDGLLERHARPEHLCRLVPALLPSGMRPLLFQGVPDGRSRPCPLRAQRGRNPCFQARILAEELAKSSSIQWLRGLARCTIPMNLTAHVRRPDEVPSLR
jgi:hypothetical protein